MAKVPVGKRMGNGEAMKQMPKKSPGPKVKKPVVSASMVKSVAKPTVKPKPVIKDDRRTPSKDIAGTISAYRKSKAGNK